MNEFPYIYTVKPAQGDHSRSWTKVVVVDRSSYLKSMYGVVNDNSKFRIITEPIHLFSIHVEDKINKFLLSMKKSDCIDEATYKTLHATGTGSGILYGKPKVHKPDFSTQYQFRPILAAYNQASYKIAKFIVPILSCLTNNQYTVKKFDRIHNENP